MKISDELRANAGTAWLNHMADRIDLEMMELPKDADGKSIHVGDTVYGCRSGMKMTISELRMTTKGWLISTSRGYLTDAEVTHTRNDSFERIADELEDWSDGNRVNWSSDVSDRAAEFAHRIRKLADKEG